MSELVAVGRRRQLALARSDSPPPTTAFPIFGTEKLYLRDRGRFIDGIDHSYSEKRFSTGGGVVAVWSYERNAPVQTYSNCQDGYLKVKFNPVEVRHFLNLESYTPFHSL